MRDHLDWYTYSGFIGIYVVVALLVARMLYWEAKRDRVSEPGSIALVSVFWPILAVFAVIVYPVYWVITFPPKDIRKARREQKLADKGKYEVVSGKLVEKEWDGTTEAGH